RAQEGHGLTRPELAVLVATAKLALQEAIEHGKLGLDPAVESEFCAAFPSAMQKQFGKAIEQHRLRGEIVATKLANRVVNTLGVLPPVESGERGGAAMAHIAAVLVVVERLLGVDAIWEAIETGAMPEDARIA